MTGPGEPTKATLGPCWFEACGAAGSEVIQGVPVSPVGASRDVVDAAARITNLGLIVCPEHAPVARNLVGL